MNVDTGGNTLLLPEVVEVLGDWGINGEFMDPIDPSGVKRCGECIAIGERNADDVDNSLAVVDKPVSVGVYNPDSFDPWIDDDESK